MRSPPPHSDTSPDDAGGPARPGPGGAGERDWPAYFAVVDGRPPRDTLLRAIDLFEREPASQTPRFAIDIGCGSGRDSLELLRRGWRVLALDAEADGIARLSAKVPPEHAPRLTARVEDFEGFMATPHEPADLVNASCSLPFCPLARFPALWEAVIAAIRPGGRFSGHFFGVRDGCGALPPAMHHTRPQVEKLLGRFAVELLEETEQEGPDAFGNPSHHHIFHIVARRPLTSTP